MPSLDIQEARIAGREDVLLLSLRGTLDIATLPVYEGALRRIREAGRSKVIVDLGGLDYISSSGLGAFLGMVDHFRKAGGDLIFVKPSEKVAKIFRVVGFQRFLSILPSVEEALERFVQPGGEPAGLELSAATVVPHSGEAFELQIRAFDAQGRVLEGFQGEALLRPSVGIVSPTKTGRFERGLWRGRVVLTGPGRVLLRASHGAVAGEAVFEVVENKPHAVLPVHLSCPGCGLRTEIRAFNVYRCRDCDEVYFVDRWAHAISLKPGRGVQPPPPKTLKVFIPADVNLLAALRVFLKTVLREHGYPEDLLNDVELSADEAVTNVVEHAYRYDTQRVVEVELVLEKDRVTVFVRDDGEAFDPGERRQVDLERHIAERRTGGLGVHLMHTMMDEVSYAREGGKNVLRLLRLVKR
jgi:anti-anti-sigma factor